MHLGGGLHLMLGAALTPIRGYWTTTTCTPAATYYTQYCSGFDLYYTYHDGACGFYDSLFEADSPTCGFVPTTTTAATTTTTEATTTTTSAPVTVFYDYSGTCTTIEHIFKIFVDSVEVVNLTATGSGSVSVPNGSTVQAYIATKFDADCSSNGGDCSPTIDESGTYTDTFGTTTSCGTGRYTTTRTLYTGNSLSYTAYDVP